jgi:RimJ/RimL family protein N-acetyltransferase
VTPSFQIEVLTADHFTAAWKLRLRALQDHPEAFGQSFEEMALLTVEEARGQFDTFWNRRDNRVYVAIAPGGEIAGMTGILREERAKWRHRGHIWGVYIAPEYRGHGLSDALLDAAIAYGRDTLGLLQVHLEVMAVNVPARRVYERAGFVQHGLMPRADILDGVALDSIQMVKIFDDYPPGGLARQDR